MLILGIDTSCDDTSAAVVEDGTRILSNIVSNQEDIHKKYGGIVPELASRRHVEMIWPIVDEALRSAGVKIEEVAAVAVCRGPGLIGSLLVGCSFAKAVCFSKGIPLVSVNHLEGHIFSCFLENSVGAEQGKDEVSSRAPEVPFISLVVSGGHTCLYRIDGFGKYSELGRTRDDAAGEAFDKVSKLLGLGYPGGPAIDRLARQGNRDAVDFPRAFLPEGLDFSFSGLKTAVLNYLRSNELRVTGKESEIRNPKSKIQKSKIQNPNGLSSGSRNLSVNDIAASFQAAVIDVLVKKAEWALDREEISRLTVSGGVGANSSLRQALAAMAGKKGIDLFVPPVSLCTDNAAMIAAAGHRHFISGDVAPLDLNPAAYLPL